MATHTPVEACAQQDAAPVHGNPAAPHGALAPPGVVAGDRDHRARLLDVHPGPQRRPGAGVDRRAARPQRPAPAGHPAPELGTVGQPLRGRTRVARADHELLLRDAAFHRDHRRCWCGCSSGARTSTAGRARCCSRPRCSALLGFFLYPTRAAAPAAAVRLHRHRAEVPHLGLAGRSGHREALQPVRRDAQPAHRLGTVVRHRDLRVRPADLGARRSDSCTRSSRSSSSSARPTTSSSTRSAGAAAVGLGFLRPVPAVRPRRVRRRRSTRPDFGLPDPPASRRTRPSVYEP